MNINIGAWFKHTVIESRSQRLKYGRRKTNSTTPNREKLTDGASLISPNKYEVQVNGTSADVGIPLHSIFLHMILM